jgi:hypothetical protein
VSSETTKSGASALTLAEKVRQLYDDFGQRKQMGLSAENVNRPHFFLHRQFAGDQDILVILNTKRCSYQCHFCQLPAKCSKTWIPTENIVAQFEYVINEMKHSLSILTRVTLSNEGSILDTDTLSTDALITIVQAVNELRLVKRLVIETRLEYVHSEILRQIKEAAPRAATDILTGFETLDQETRDEILFKREPIEVFLSGLDRVGEVGADLTSYVLFKPNPSMTDEEAFNEAEKSMDFLADQCEARHIPLFIRLNPMYAASGSKWAQLAHQTTGFRPPRLTDIMRLAEKVRRKGIGVYIGLSAEGLDEPNGNYMSREDYSPKFIKPIKLFNEGRLSSFEGIL